MANLQFIKLMKRSSRPSLLHYLLLMHRQTVPHFSTTRALSYPSSGHLKLNLRRIFPTRRWTLIKRLPTMATSSTICTTPMPMVPPRTQHVDGCRHSSAYNWQDNGSSRGRDSIWFIAPNRGRLKFCRCPNAKCSFKITASDTSPMFSISQPRVPNHKILLKTLRLSRFVCLILAKKDRCLLWPCVALSQTMFASVVG